MVWCSLGAGGGAGTGEFVLQGHGVSVWEMNRVLQTGGGEVCTAM